MAARPPSEADSVDDNSVPERAHRQAEKQAKENSTSAENTAYHGDNAANFRSSRPSLKGFQNGELPSQQERDDYQQQKSELVDLMLSLRPKDKKLEELSDLLPSATDIDGRWCAMP